MSDARALAATATGRVAGTIADGVHVFKGIPFAAPPVGDRRFRPPAPAEPWSGELDATRFGPVALQSDSPLETALGSRGIKPDEDCLRLNVWTPGLDDAARPVMVWIHGGAFVTGSGSTPWYDGTNFARHHDVVVATVNYRLGAFGFLHLDDVAGDAFAGSGNVGILDQVAALEWVRDNIAAFGGDAGNVTIFGESAGGMSVGTLLGLPAAKGLFQRAVAQSGAAHNAQPRDLAGETARQLLAELGLPADAGGVAQLCELPADAVLAAQAVVLAGGYAGGRTLAFSPTVDGTVLPQRPIDAVAGGSASDVSVLAGTTRDEMQLFGMLDPSLTKLDEASLLGRIEAVVGERAGELISTYRALWPEAGPSRIWSRLQTDYVFRMPAVRLAEAQASVGNPAYLYRFDWATPTLGGHLGACHALEIPFVFDNLDAPGADLFVGERSPEMRALAASMNAAWAGFARTGDAGWPAYELGGRPSMRLDLTSELVDDIDAPIRDAWEGIL